MAREGVPTFDGRALAQGSMKMRADRPKVPLTVRYAGGGKARGHDGVVILGWASDLQREPDGWLTMELSHPIVGLAPEIDVCGMVLASTDPWVISEAFIIAVHLGTKPVWDGLVMGS